MAEDILKELVTEKLSSLGSVEIIVRIPSYNNARTIGHVSTEVVPVVERSS